jgi:16S rRNA processing protein RimM
MGRPLGDSALVLGRVLRTRGLDGQLVVQSDAEEPRTLLRARRIFLDAEPGLIPYLVREAQPLGPSAGGTLVGVRLAGLETRERAATWVGAQVRIDAGDLAPLPEGELYWRDLLGLACRTRDGRELGVIEEIWPTPACDQILVKGPAGRWFLPARDDVLIRVDREARTVWVDVPPGLLDAGEDEA